MAAHMTFRNGAVQVVEEIQTALPRRVAFTVIAVPTGFRLASVAEGIPGFAFIEDEPVFSGIDAAQSRADAWNVKLNIHPADVWDIVASAMDKSPAWTLSRA